MTQSKVFVRLLASSALLVVSTPLFAQDAPTAPAADSNAAANEEPSQPGAPASESSAASPQQGLQDIVVTAQRTASSAQRTPVALSVYTGDDAEAAGVTNVLTLQRIDPSINVTTSTGASYVAVRGIASTDVTETGDPSVPIARDGFFTNRSFSVGTSIYDLDRIEVLKGPQGTLFGRNSTGGLIHMITRRPGHELGVDGSLEIGNYSTFNADLGVDVPVGEDVQFRLSGIRRYHKGYRKLDVIGGRGDDDDTWSGRATMTFQPFNGFRGWLQYQHDDIDNVGDVALKTPLGVRPDGLSSKHFPNFEPSFNKLKGDRYRWEFSYDQLPANLTLTYAGGFDQQHWRHQLDATSLDPVTLEGVGFASFRQAENPDTWNHEVRLATPQDAKVSAQVGYFHFSEHNKDLDSGLILRGGPVEGQYLVHFLYDVKTQSDAVFGQFGFRPIDELRLSAGARYTWDKKKRTGFSQLRCDFAGIPPFLWPIICPGTPPILQVNTPEGGERYDESKPTFHVGADWQITPRNMVYAKFDTGYKSGGFNSNGSAAPVPYGSESVKAWEIGSKNRFLDNHLQLNGDAFYQIYDGYQASQNSAVVSSGNGVFNVGKAEIYGLEAQLVGTFGAARFDANTTLLHTEFTHVDEPGITRGNSVTVPPEDIEGNHLPNAPQFVVTAGFEYEIDLGAVTLTPRIDGKHSSSYYFSVFNDPDTRQHAYTIGNVSLNVVPRNLPFEVLFFVRNFTDKRVFAHAAQNFVTNPFPINTYEFQPPRTYGVRASVKF